MENNETGSAEHNYLEDPSAYLSYDYASTGQRFLNFLIDNLLMRFGLNYITGYVVGIFLGRFFPVFITSVISGGNQIGFLFLIYLISILNYLIYYTLCEKLFRGYTLGKAITRTRAINDDFTELTFKNALLRSLCRLVPFEVFSGFKIRPWHDEWTNTMVIKVR